eukprot:gene36729-60341_t
MANFRFGVLEGEDQLTNLYLDDADHLVAWDAVQQVCREQLRRDREEARKEGKPAPPEAHAAPTDPTSRRDLLEQALTLVSDHADDLQRRWMGDEPQRQWPRPGIRPLGAPRRPLGAPSAPLGAPSAPPRRPLGAPSAPDGAPSAPPRRPLGAPSAPPRRPE